MAMRVSVIIPLFNQSAVVAEAAQSALAQTLPPLEVIVADDGSTDGGATAAGLDPRVRVVSQPRRGPAAARNLAARQATGDWLAFLDADDLWLPEKLERQSAAASANPDAVLIHADGYIVGARGAPLPSSTFFADRVPPAGRQAASALLRSPLLTPAVMIRRDAFEAAGGFDERLRMHEDMELYFRLAAGGAEFAYVPEPLVVVRMIERRRDLREYLSASVELQEHLRRAFPAYAPELVRRISSTWRALAALALSRGDDAGARAAYRRSLSRRGPNRADLAALLLLRLGRRDRLLEMNRLLLEKLGASAGAPGD